MSEKIIHAKMRLKPRSDTAANWQSKNPVLLSGESGIVTDGTETDWLKIGDGVTPWNSLPWKRGPEGREGRQGPKGDDAVTDAHYNSTSDNAQSGKAVAEGIGRPIWLGKFDGYDQNSHEFVDTISITETEPISMSLGHSPVINNQANTALFSTDFYNYNPHNPPKVNDYVVTQDGGLYQITLLSETNRTIVFTFKKSLTAVDEHYSGTSIYPQSGKAVAEAVRNRNIFRFNSVNDGTSRLVECLAKGATQITIPNDFEGQPVSIVCAEAFEDCSMLTSIIVPDSVTQIMDSAFDDCVNLTDVYFKGTQEQWDLIDIGSTGNTPLENATIHYDYISPTNEYYTKLQTENLLDDKQNALTAGPGITIQDNVISATGGGGSENNFELIEEINLTAQTTASIIERTIDTQGNAYNFKDVMVFFKFPTAVSTSTRLSLIIYFANSTSVIDGTQQQSAKIFSLQPYAQNATVLARTFRQNGAMNFAISTSGTATQNADTTPLRFTPFTFLTGNAPIVKIGLQFGTDATPVNFPDDCKIRIYGVKY